MPATAPASGEAGLWLEIGRDAALRRATVNFRTTDDDIHAFVEHVELLGRALRER